MTTQAKEQPGVCPEATDIMVYRDEEGRWRGRFHDGAPRPHYVVLPNYNGMQAQKTLAKYLGVPSKRVRLFEATGRVY